MTTVKFLTTTFYRDPSGVEHRADVGTRVPLDQVPEAADLVEQKLAAIVEDHVPGVPATEDAGELEG